MATEGPFALRDGQLIAGADLSAKQYYFVKLGATEGEVDLIAALTDRPYGVLQNTPKSGEEADVLLIGITKLVSDAAIADGVEIGTSADGQADAKDRGTDSGQFIVGVMLETSGAAAEITRALINCPAAGMAGENLPTVERITQTVAFGDFTDGGAAVGTLVMDDALPLGAIVLGAKVLVPAGFAGDTTAVLIIGDGSDTDRYSTGTPSVFATAATGIQAGVPSGSKLLTAANTPTLTITVGTDWGAVTAGSLEVSIYYIKTI